SHTGRHRSKLTQVDVSLGFQEDGFEAGRSEIPLLAFVVHEIAGGLFLIMHEVLRCLRHRDAKPLHDVGAIDPALPKKAEFNELQPLFDTPAHSLSAPLAPRIRPSKRV